MAEDLEQRGIDVIRALAMDAVQQANSGHPGTPMALAPLAHVLWTRVMRYDASTPEWPDRDRFVLSAGHASMLLYAMLYLTGFGLELDDIRAFRQLHSATPGHPERLHTAGVEVTTGPLGQGFANSVGMAIAEANLRARFGEDVCNHHIFTICSDGDLEEGVSHEAASLAGHLGLGRLVSVYDDNHISIDGPTELAFSEDVPKRFEAYGWHVLELGEVANDLDALEAGLRAGIAETERPTLLVLRSHIGWPSPRFTDTAAAHGSPLGAEEVAAVKEILGLSPDAFDVPLDVLEHYRAAGRRGRAEREAWQGRRLRLRETDAPLADEHDACLDQRGLAGWASKLPTWEPGASVATRRAMGSVFEAVVDVVPGLVLGGADLTENTGTELKGADALAKGALGGRQLHFGVREHAMGSIMNGMAASGLLPAGGTFFVFSDYMRPPVRLAALARYKSTFVWTHDSVGLGEDGPTHQPVEQLASFRAMPGLCVIRPADANEVAQAYRVHVDGERPTALILSRQNLPVLAGTVERAADGVARGAYRLVDEPASGLDVVLLASGSEVAVCVEAAERLGADGIGARVVSFPSWDLFEAQPQSYRDSVLPPGIPVLAVEAAAPFGWERYADDTIGIATFGLSAPGAQVLAEFGFTPEHVAERARALATRGG